MIKIYGHPSTSAGRCYWMLEELGLAYEMPNFNMKNGDHRSPEYLKLNPNGKVPCLVDDDFVIWESMAINHYLAEKHRPSFFGANIQDKALTMQWCYWAIAEYQKPLVDLLIQMVFVPEPKRDAELMAKSREKIAKLNLILNGQLAGKSYLVGNEFTLADLNVASVAKINKMVGINISESKNLDLWLNNICERPACLKVDKMGRA